jgi:hypothetical protein
MVELKTAYYITCNDVEELTGVHWNEFEFAEMAENDSYQILCCADWYLEELYEEFEDVKDELDEIDMDNKWSCRHCYPMRLKNQINLVEILRKQYGCRDTVLIRVSW